MEAGPDGNYRLKIKAPPVDGKANEEIRRFLAELFNLPKSMVELKSGHTGRIKTAEIHLEEARFQQRLKELIG